MRYNSRKRAKTISPKIVRPNKFLKNLFSGEKMYNPTKPYIANIKNKIRTTWETKYVSVREGPLVTRKFSCPIESSSIDGIGTKGVYHWAKRSFRYAVADALAMNINDLLLNRAVAYKLQDNITLPEEDTSAIGEIIDNLSRECKGRHIAITDGETAIENTMKGCALTIAMAGFIKHPIPNQFQIGDALIGLTSSGLHANGFTKIRDLFGEKIIRPEFIEPTMIYSDILFYLMQKFFIHGMVHITGGAYTKIKQFLPENADICIRRNHGLRPHEIFRDIYQKKVSDEDMYKTFNCGIGFIFSVDAKNAKNVLSYLDMLTDAADIGEVTAGTGMVKIESAFSKKEITL